MRDAASPNGITGRKVLIFMIGCFLVVLVANGALIYFSQASWTGLVTDAYRRGMNYNQELAAVETQKALGWTALWEAETPASPYLRIGFRRADGSPLRDLRVTAEWRHPAKDTNDRSIDLVHMGDGYYAATAELPSEGRWQVRVMAEDTDGNRYRVDRELFIR